MKFKGEITDSKKRAKIERDYLTKKSPLEVEMPQ